MNEFAATRGQQRSQTLAGIRRIESAILATTAVIPVVALGGSGLPLSLALFAAAVVLLPRHRDATISTHEERRLELVKRLLAEAGELNFSYMATRELPGSPARAQALAETRLDIIQWTETSRRQMQRYPEFVGIFEAHGGKDRSEELNGRIARLGEIMRLAQTSKRLGLPI